MKKLLFMFILIFVWYLSLTQAQSLMPEWWDNPAAYVSGVSVWWHVLEEQRNLIRSWDLSLWDQFASWIFGRDAILDYCVYLVRFLWEVALLVWALAIIFLWYKRITKNIFWEAPKGLTMVIVWILIIIFAYVIVKLIWSAFIS